MFRVGIKNTLRANHFLRGEFGEESLPHEHEYVVEWSCFTEELDENGFSVDIAVMEEQLERVLERLRGRSLNELEFFRDRQVSVENLARYLHAVLMGALGRAGAAGPALLSSQIKIWESDTAWAAYSSA